MTTSNELTLQFNMLKEQKADLIAQRSKLPRNDKQNAHRLLVEINSIDAKLKKIKPSIQVIKAEESARASHAMWVMAVRELFGMDGLTQCYEFMRQEKQFRRRS